MEVSHTTDATRAIKREQQTPLETTSEPSSKSSRLVRLFMYIYGLLTKVCPAQAVPGRLTAAEKQQYENVRTAFDTYTVRAAESELAERRSRLAKAAWELEVEELQRLQLQRHSGGREYVHGADQHDGGVSNELLPSAIQEYQGPAADNDLGGSSGTAAPGTSLGSLPLKVGPWALGPLLVETTAVACAAGGRLASADFNAVFQEVRRINGYYKRVDVHVRLNSVPLVSLFLSPLSSLVLSSLSLPQSAVRSSIIWFTVAAFMGDG